ncbi:MAG: transglutaminase domain-containing protein [Candidatus Coatesbacteria bacterium]|nr:transglutaminase domain-containing protein [Candidatus Coatesbacteria bacterium]
MKATSRLGENGVRIHTYKATLILSLFLTLIITAQVFPSAADETILHDSWDAVLMAGARMGFVHTEISRQEADGEVRFVTRMETEMEMMRGTDAARATISNEVVESEQGKILSFHLRMATSGEPMETTGTFSDGKLKIRQEMMGRANELEVSLPEGSIGPYATLKLMREKGFEPGTKYTIQTFEGQSLKALNIGIEVMGKESVIVSGERMMLNRLKVEQSIMPMMTIHEWCDDDGQILRTEIEQLSMVTMRTTKEDALSGSSSPKVDLLIKLSAPSDTFIPHPYLTKKAVYTISMPDSVDYSFPSDGIQMFTREDGLNKLSVATRAYREAPSQSQEFGNELQEYLEASPYIQSDDPKIIEIARSVAGAEDNLYKKAILLREWVSENISLKDYSVAFASAREVAEQRRGDCSEHGVLLAAILRAAGIPARCVVGLVYADGAFYYHLWNEAYISSWIPLDAAMRKGGNDWDAVHVKLGTSSLNSFMPTLELASILPTMGNLKIEVLSLGYGGPVLDVKDPGTLSFVMGNRYEDVLYSFRVEKPRKAMFDRPASPFTSSRLLTIHSPGYSNAELTVEVNSAGPNLELSRYMQRIQAAGEECADIDYFEIDKKPAIRFVSGKGAERALKAVIYDRDNLIVIKATGDDKWSKKLFKKAVKSFEFTAKD